MNRKEWHDPLRRLETTDRSEEGEGEGGEGEGRGCRCAKQSQISSTGR